MHEAADDKLQSKENLRSVLIVASAFIAAMIVMLANSIPTSFGSIFPLVVACVAVLPLLRRYNDWESPFFKTYSAAFTYSIATLGTVAIYVFLYHAHPTIGGVDWFYYLCYARDQINGVPTSENIYSYFPGVYMFWRQAMFWFGFDVDALRCIVILVLLINAVLVELIIWRQTRSVALSWIGGLVHGVLLIRFQGLSGVTEPVALIPLLVALVVWNGDAFVRWKKSVTVGICLGLVVLCKQQAGLLTLGALVWLPAWKQHDKRQVIAIPIIALLTLVLLTLTEGAGLTPLFKGLDTAASYANEGSMFRNILIQAVHDPIATLALLSTCGITFWLSRQELDEDSTSQVRIIGFLMIGAIASLVQFSFRNYHHYFQLALPAASIGLILSLHILYRLKSPLRNLVFPFAIAILGYQSTTHIDTDVLQWPNKTYIQHYKDWHDQAPIAVALKDHEKLQQVIQTKEPVISLPPRYSSFFYLTGLRSASAHGYSFREFDMKNGNWFDEIANRNITPEFVILWHFESPESSSKDWNAQNGPAAQKMDALSNRYVRFSSQKAYTIWRRR